MEYVSISIQLVSKIHVISLYFNEIRFSIKLLNYLITKLLNKTCISKAKHRINIILLPKGVPS